MVDDMILSEEFIAKGLIKAETCLYEGISLNEYSREELIAIAVELGSMYNDAVNRSISSMQLLRDLQKARG